MRGVGRLRIGVLATLLAGLTACSSSPPPSSAPGSGRVPTTTAAPSSTTQPGGLPTPAHVVVVVFENKAASQILGTSAAPYLTSLAKQGALLRQSYAVAHPSQPNYIALFSGSTQGVTDDSCPQKFDGQNLAAQLREAGRSFAGYSEDMPAEGFTGCGAGGYARKHNPWADFPALPASVNQPYSALPADYAQLPTVSFLVPNLCDDMHSCPVAKGDAWARAHLDGYVRWARDHNSLLVVTFDEDDHSQGNHIATFLVGPMVRPGASDQHIDHYSVLRTLEDMYRLPPLGEAANREPITGVWTAP